MTIQTMTTVAIVVATAFSCRALPAPWHIKQIKEFRGNMNNTDAVPPYETQEIGTPLDYTSDMYRVYFEIRDHDGMAKEIISGFLGPVRAEKIETLAHGYEIELPIQCIPEIIRLLATENIAIYQVVRYAKTNNSWG